MSWIDKVKNGFIITTGDGKKYTPSWLNASFVTEYQISEFHFIGVPGSLVLQEQPIGTKYSLEIYFQGDGTDPNIKYGDHLVVADQFKNSCNDKRPWTVEHPLYDLIFVKVASLTFDNSQYNCTKITGTMIETILQAPPNISVDQLAQVPIQFEQTVNDLVDSLTETPTPTDINILTNDNLTAYKKGVPIITPLSGWFDEYTNAFSTAQSYIDTATATPLLMMRSLMNVLAMPSQFEASVKTRIGVLLSTFNSLRDNLVGLLNNSSKRLFQNKQSVLLAAMCQAAAQPLITDYKNAVAILEILESIIAARTRLIQDLDILQTATGGSLQSFIADAKPMISLNALVNTTTAALYNLSLSARSERNIYLEKDTNWIVLAHRLYGLDANDNNVNDLMDENGATMEGLFQVEKGRKIVYYY